LNIERRNSNVCNLRFLLKVLRTNCPDQIAGNVGAICCYRVSCVAVYSRKRITEYPHLYLKVVRFNNVSAPVVAATVLLRVT